MTGSAGDVDGWTPGELATTEDQSPIGEDSVPHDDAIKVELHDLLATSTGQLGEVARCLANGITDRRAIVEAGAAANNGAVGNIFATIRAIEDGIIPTAPSIARLSASAVRSFRKQHKQRMTEGALIRIDHLIEELTEAGINQKAQEEEQVRLTSESDDLEKTLETAGGVYVYTYPHYYKYPTIEGTNRTLMKVGHSAVDAPARIRAQTRQTAIPEDPLILRVYTHPQRHPRDLEKDFHKLMTGADFDRSSTTGGREWFEVSLEYLDTVADVLGCTTRQADETA